MTLRSFVRRRDGATLAGPDPPRPSRACLLHCDDSAAGFLGDAAAQAEHEREMSGGMAAISGMHADDPSATTVQPGQTATLTHTFTTAGSTIIGCHEPGHSQAGMKLTVVVG